MVNILTIDVSTQSSKASVINERGERLAIASIPHRTYGEAPISEQDAVEWWENSKKAIRKVLSDGRIREDVRVIVANGTPYGVVPVDREGRPLTRAIIYVDKRATKEAAAVAKTPQFQEVTRTTGSKANGTHPIPKILWIKENQPEIYERTHMFLDPTAYLTYQLTGQYATDVWNNFRCYGDPVTGQLPKNLLDALGIDIRKFPEVYPIGSKSYPLRRELAAEFGLPSETQVVIATNDSGLAVIGSGISKPGDTSESGGSANVLKTLTEHMLADPKERVYPQPALQKGKWYIGGYEMAGGVFEWYKNTFIGQDPTAYETMNQEAQSSAMGANGVIFLPHIFGAKCPVYDPNARGIIFGIKSTTTRADITRAMFESVCFLTRDIIEAFEQVGAKVGDIYLSGGLSQSDVLTQIKADVTGRKIHVLQERHTTSLGAAIVAATSLGEYPTIEEAAKAMVKIRRSFEPNPNNKEGYDRVFAEWKRLYYTAKPLTDQEMREMKAKELHTLSSGLTQPPADKSRKTDKH